MFRFISVMQRKRRFKKDEERSLALFYHYKQAIEKIPLQQSKNKKLLIIRLDDIGDYLLFRNTLVAYKQSHRWQGYSVTLLGNEMWKELFELWDNHTTDDAIWLNKKEYLHNDDYKHSLWKNLRAEGFEVVVCPSVTRPFMLDDLCRLATGAQTAIGISNFTPHKKWKHESDKLYDQLYHPCNIKHEFFLNQEFVNWCCYADLHLQRPSVPQTNKRCEGYVLCFIGASTKSRRWPRQRWIQLVRLIQSFYSLPVKIVGVAQHKEDALKISDVTHAESITDITLTSFVDVVKNAKLIVSNDTMAAHLGVSCHVPVVIVSSGNNFTRFTVYKEANIASVCAVYPNLVNRKRKQMGDEALHNHIVTTSDIASIKAKAVFNALQELL